ncbi:MAG: M20/M25/M40 family metallo-hydrolase [Planctomycetes bacterium]|nr:M20/M25/M40 family metallo-hydrolase [Planctomycetota bacterium]
MKQFPLWTVSTLLLLGFAAPSCRFHWREKQAAAAPQELPQPVAVRRQPAMPVSPSEGLARIVEAAKKENRVSEHLRQLCTQFGARLTGSTALAKASEWTRKQFAGFGLDAQIEEWGTFPVGFDRGPWSGRIVSPEPAPLVCGFNAWSAGTRGPVAGPAKLLPATPEAASDGSWKGAWVMVPAPPPRARRDGAASRAASQPTSTADAASAARRRNEIETALEQAGVAGFVTTEGGDLIHTAGNPQIKPDKLPTVPRMKLRGEDHKKISDQIAAGVPVVLEFDAQVTFRPGPVSNVNVIADLRGSQFPDEMVIVGGHIDSWDGALGTTDNGTGVATTLEAARLLKAAGLVPRRTIRFMLWSGEEQGLLGSRGWIQKHRDLLPKISAVLVHDGGTAYVSGIAATKAMEPIFQEIFAPLATLDPKMPFKVRPTPDGLPVGIGSDHDSFLQIENPVPGFFWDQAGGVDYNRTHHTQYDTMEAERPEYQRHSAVVIAAAALAVANLEKPLPREGLVNPSARRGRGRVLGFTPGEDGLTVADVTEGGAGHKAGLQVGDKILEIGSVKVTNLDELRAAMAAAPSKTQLKVARGAVTAVLSVEWPQAAQSRPNRAPSDR